MDRLLSDDKLRIFRDRSGGDVSQLKELITEQDLKTVDARDKEWVAMLKYVNQATDLKDLDARFQFLLKDMGVKE